MVCQEIGSSLVSFKIMNFIQKLKFVICYNYDKKLVRVWYHLNKIGILKQKKMSILKKKGNWFKFGIIYGNSFPINNLISAIGSDLEGFTTRLFAGANYGRTQAGHKERRRLLIEVNY